MAVQDRRIEIGVMLVWTKGSDTNACVHAASAGLETAGLQWLRPSVLITMGNSGSARAALGFQLADEDRDDAWGTTTALSGSYVSSDTTTYDSAFQDVSATVAAKRLIRFVILCKDTAGVSTVETMFAGGAVDLRNA